MQIQSRHGRVQPQRFPALPLPFIEQPVNPAGHLQRLQGVLQAGQVVLRQQRVAARQPEVFQFTGQVSTYSLFAPLTEQPPDFRSQFFTEASLFF